MPVSGPILVFCLDEQRYGLELRFVDRVLRVLAITPLPGVPEIVLGVIDVEGSVLPVVDLRQRFGLPRRDLELSDQLVLAKTARRPLALLVDGVEGVELADASRSVAAETVLPKVDYVAAILKRADGLTLIHDLDSLLALGEERVLEAALTAERSNA